MRSRLDQALERWKSSALPRNRVLTRRHRAGDAFGVADQPIVRGLNPQTEDRSSARGSREDISLVLMPEGTGSVAFVAMPYHPPMILQGVAADHLPAPGDRRRAASLGWLAGWLAGRIGPTLVACAIQKGQKCVNSSSHSMEMA